MPTTAEKPKPFLLPEYCKGCGRCIEACAKHCIELGTEINPQTGLIPVRPEPRGLLGLRPLHDRLPGALRPRAGGDVRLRAPGPGEALRRPAVRGRRAGDDPGRASSRCPQTRPLVTKGTYASAIGALLAGCRHFFGYPITPSTEGAELMAKLLPQLDGVFVQAVSEVATVNMMYGCGGAGLRAHDLHVLARASA